LKEVCALIVVLLCLLCCGVAAKFGSELNNLHISSAEACLQPIPRCSLPLVLREPAPRSTPPRASTRGREKVTMAKRSWPFSTSSGETRRTTKFPIVSPSSVYLPPRRRSSLWTHVRLHSPVCFISRPLRLSLLCPRALRAAQSPASPMFWRAWARCILTLTNISRQSVCSMTSLPGAWTPFSARSTQGSRKSTGDSSSGAPKSQAPWPPTS